MLLEPGQNYYPYYVVGNLKTHSKFEALGYAKQHNITDVRFHFHDEIFSSYDWTIEPTESLSELYKQRAEQLRDQYEYLILGFSGGADSTNILRTFVDNNIHLDEIVVYHSLDGDGQRNSFYNFETFNVALPYVTQYIDQTKTKITVIDTTQATLDYWKYVNKFDFLHYNSFCFSPNNLARNIIKVQNAELRKSYNTNKTVGYITGLDKPIVSYFDGKAFFKFNDCIDTTVSYVLHDKGYNREIDEFFYWTPNFPKIVIKQSHVLKRYYDTQNLDVALANTVPSGLGTIIKQGKTYQIDHKVLPGLLYDNWNIETPSVGKSNTGLVFSQRDIWFFNSGLAEAKSFKDAMQHFFSNIHSDYVNNNTQMTSVKHILSKPYFITKH